MFTSLPVWSIFVTLSLLCLPISLTFIAYQEVEIGIVHGDNGDSARGQETQVCQWFIAEAEQGGEGESLYSDLRCIRNTD